MGKQIIDFAMVSVADDKEMQFKEYRGKIAVMITIYTSCFYGCIGVVKSCDELAATYADKGVKFLLCNIEGKKAKSSCETFASKNDIKTMDHFIGEAPELLKLAYIPHKVFVSKDGEIILNYKGNFEAEIEKVAEGGDTKEEEKE